MRQILSIVATVSLLSISRASAADTATLLEAARAGKFSAVQTSLQQRTDPNQAEPDGTTALHWAVQQDRLDIVQALISAGVNPDRIRTVSYGKEKQFCTEANEQCYQQNRRAGFSVDR